MTYEIPDDQKQFFAQQQFDRMLAETAVQALADGKRAEVRALLINYDPRRAILATLDTLNVMIEGASDGQDITNMILNMRNLIAGPA